MEKSLADRLGPARLPFLLLPPMCVALGYATASQENPTIPVLSAILALIGAVASHVSVNSFNEYFDFRSKVDERTSRTPFSGGSGTLQRRPELAGWALGLAIGSALLTSAIGLYFFATVGTGILPVGIAGVFIVVTYSIWAVKHPLICLLYPGLGFGTCMVLGTHYVLAGSYSVSALIASMIPFFLVSNLLLLNQFPDVEADRSVGRKTLPIIAGVGVAAQVYAAFVALTFVSIVVGVVFKQFPLPALIALATILLAIPSVTGAFKHGKEIPKLIPAMGQNVIMNLVTPLLLAVGIFFGK